MRRLFVLILFLALVQSGYAQTSFGDTETSTGPEGVHHGFNIHPLGKICDLCNKIPFLRRQELGGLRNKLEDKGYTFTVVYTGDYVSNTSGGLERGSSYIDNLDLTMTLDTAKAGLWEHGTFFIYGLYNAGTDRPSEKLVGDLQGVDNIDAPRLFKLFELWYEHNFFDKKLSIRAGLYNLNSEFDTTEYGALFLNSSFGIEPTISANTTSSIFPLASPAFRLKWDLAEHVTLQGAVLSGDPGDEDTNPHGFNPVWNNKRGTMIVGEGQIHGDVPLPYGALPGTLKVGAWDNTKDVDDLTAVDGSGDPVRHSGNYGLYAVIDQMLFREKDEQGLGAFFQYGQAPSDRNTLDKYIGLGLHYKGLLPDRDEDSLGVSYNRALTSDDYRSTGDFDKFEEVMEATYRIQFTESVVLQPDFQVVHNPGADPAIKDAKVATVRFQVTF